MNRHSRTLFFALLLIVFAFVALEARVPKPPDEADLPKKRSFRENSKILLKIYQGDLASDLYCGCKFSGKESIDFSTCDFEPRDNPKRKSYARAERIEWEHMVTAHNMGKFRQCWQNGGRKNCVETDPEFQIMEGDLHNLYPSIGEINGDRSNYMFSQWTNNPVPMYGTCQTIVDFKGKKAQPRPEARGIIARAHFYMEREYGIKLSNQDRKLFNAWDKTYPVTELECVRDSLIALYQGNHNPFVEAGCEAFKE